MRRLSRSFLLDASIAVVLGLWAQAMVWFGTAVDGGLPAVAGPKWIVAPAFLLVGFPLIMRRSAPLAVCLMYDLAVAIQAVSSHKSAEGGALIFACYVAMFSLGAYASRWSNLIGVGALAASLAVSLSLDPYFRTPAEIWSGVFWDSTPLIAWLAGLAWRGVRARRRLEAEAAQAKVAHEGAVADERARMARELHDVVSHHVSVTVVQAVAAQGLLDKDPERVRAPLAEIERTSREAMGELRRLLDVMRGGDIPSLAPQPTHDDFGQLVHSLESAGLETNVVVKGSPPAQSSVLGLTIYRLIQEALTNVLKHAAATRVDVAVEYGEKATSVTISDNGIGVANGEGPGHGLVGMRERVEILGGTLTTGRAPRGGFRVVAVLPNEASS